MELRLKQAFRLSDFPRLALVGAGGKTTALFQLARQFSPPVIVCATTHLALDQLQLADEHYIIEKIEDTNFLIDRPLSGVVLLTGHIDGQRTQGLTNEIVEWLDQFCGYRSLPLLIEADGARQLPLKAPGPHEPVIPKFVDTVVVVVGMSGLGQPLTEDWVFRPEIFAELSGLDIGDLITSEAIGRVVAHPQGGLRNIPKMARKILLLNQADSPEVQSFARELVDQTTSAYESVVVSALRPVSSPQSSVIYSVNEPIAGIILAAGEGRRYGAPKQLLDWKGKPLVWHVAHKALSVGLSPVVVVGGAYTDQIRSALKGLSVEVVHNPEWAEGQSTSIKVGLKAAPRLGGGAIFLLADQPQVPELLIRQLVEKHAQTLAPIVAPLVQGQRANPVLFDRVAFKDFGKLSGDVGGRKLFSKFPVTWVDWHDELPLMDIDTPQDYQKLLDFG